MLMTSMASLQTTQYRLARHYLSRLRAANSAFRHGQASISYGLAVFDQEWEQIRYWQAEAAKRGIDERWAQLCKEFPLAGLEILTTRNDAADQATWLVTALTAAQQLGDAEAERILCHELYTIYYRLGIPEKIEYFANQLLKLGEAANDLLSVERAYHGLGTFAEEVGLYDEAEAYYQRALDLALELGIDTEIAQGLHGVASIAYSRGDFQKAYHYFSRRLELLETTGNKSLICHALLMMGFVLHGLKAYASAEDYLQRSVMMSRALGYQRLLGSGLLNLGLLALELNQLETAHSDVQEALRALRSVGIVRMIMVALSQQGYILLRMGKLPASLAHLQEGLQMARESGRPRELCDLLFNLTSTYLALNDLDAARSSLSESLILTQRMGAFPKQVEAVTVAVAYFQSLGRPEQAAVWAGSITGETMIDLTLFKQACARLEAALGAERYQAALEKGKTRALDEVVAEVLTALA